MAYADIHDRWTMTHALRARLLAAIDNEWRDDPEYRTELRQLVTSHYVGDALSAELVDAVEHHGLERFAGVAEGS